MKGERKLALGLAALGLVLAIIAWRGMDTRGEDALVASADTSGRETVWMVWAGDTMVGDASVAVAVQHGYEWPFAGVRHLLDGDVVVVNAEGPLTTLNQPFSPSKRLLHGRSRLRSGTCQRGRYRPGSRQQPYA